MEGSHIDTATRIARLADANGITVASAESMTGGLLAADLARAPDMAGWFRGGVVACTTAVQRDVLCVRPGPVISERAVIDMADGVALLLGATAAVAVSGVAGPLPFEGQQPGTVWFGVRSGTTTFAEVHHLHGEPEAICVDTCSTALELLLHGLTQR